MDDTYESKKKYLKSYRDSKRAVENISMAITELKAAQLMASKDNDGMPHAKNNKTDLSDYVSRLEDLEKEYNVSKGQYLDICAKVISSIQKISDERQKAILMYRYITLDNYCWDNVYKKMNENGYICEVSNMFNIHRDAINNIIIIN